MEQVGATGEHVRSRAAVGPETRRGDVSDRFGVPGPLVQLNLIGDKVALGLLHGCPFARRAGERQR